MVLGGVADSYDQGAPVQPVDMLWCAWVPRMQQAVTEIVLHRGWQGASARQRPLVLVSERKTSQHARDPRASRDRGSPLTSHLSPVMYVCMRICIRICTYVTRIYTPGRERRGDRGRAATSCAPRRGRADAAGRTRPAVRQVRGER